MAKMALHRSDYDQARGLSNHLQVTGHEAEDLFLRLSPDINRDRPWRIGHAAQWWKVVYPVLSTRVSEPRMLNMLLAVWLFVSGGMLSFGLALMWTGFRIRKGDRGVVVIPIGIAVFYFIFGVLSWIFVGKFFALFVVLSTLLFISTWVLNVDRTMGRS